MAQIKDSKDYKAVGAGGREAGVLRVPDAVRGMDVVITGTLSIRRDKFVSLLEGLGIRVSNTMTWGCVLVVGEERTRSSKRRKAEQIGSRIYTEREFVKLLKGEADA